MFTYKMNVDVQEWDLFLENHPQGNLLQSSDWAKIKDTWGNERVGFYKENQLVWSSEYLNSAATIRTFYVLYSTRSSN